MVEPGRTVSALEADEVADGDVEEPEPAGIPRRRLVFRRFLRNRMALVGLVVIVLLFAIAYLGHYLTPWDYNEQDFTSFLEPPSAEHWFGTTRTGGDVFALTMRGLQKSLVIGLLVGLIATGFATVIGTFAAYYGGAVDRVLMWGVDLLLVLPAFLVIAVLSPTFQGTTWLMFVALLALFSWMVPARAIRAMTFSVKEQPYVQAARFMGVSGPRIVFRHIIPNISSFIIIDATLQVGFAVIAEAGLSYFGFGVQPPDVSLGTLISDGARSAISYPWLFLFAGGALVLFVLAVNFVGDGLRDALDPDAEGGSR
ncbi:peptide/nickel transport system permease protein [Halopolyspora algeriensis]|uniref:Oligopeptide transport system permease protein OppC n=1 Tax=Halopolyspora algeriensis TaxID=1500506 RepID=A0A368VGA8_9ACTN|nr:ABC transporter permease [Halopolyspora algeriensis]RCW40358.1 peptide/nickel transport system permease protein [Halopolyspora algeriensis]TQM53642.1 peptide/nickel transport system permease protein [Halopolyspora algeriensis]